MTGMQIRALCRNGSFDGPTAGVALGHVQANLVVLPAERSKDFERFCLLNPKPCPLLEIMPPGQFEPIEMASGADLRKDLPRYRVYRDGQLVAQPTSIEQYWEDDSTAFLIGCSFSFESALLSAGVPVRHIEESVNVPMYRSSLACRSSGPFVGPLIVSMRPMTPAHAEIASTITEAMPGAHGGPIQVGDPAAIGIAVDALSRPDYGQAVSIRAGEIPVFWACGVTPLEAILRAKPALAVTHEPGHMFVTDRTDGSVVERSHP